jgi:prepilin-type N-terminal cleavage/methylation domain-containing protein
MPRRTHRVVGDAGVTLVELLVAVAIMGVAFAAIIGGMYTYTVGSATHRSQADVQLQLRTYAESIAEAPFVTCPTAVYANAAAYTAPAGFTVTNTTKLWDTATSTFDITPTAGCTSTLQRVTLIVAKTGPYPYSESLDIVKRSP